MHSDLPILQGPQSLDVRRLKRDYNSRWHHHQWV